jgi:ArsR family metal-binding transcriptional regulator
MKDVIVVRHPEFARLAHQLSIAAERFNEAAREKHVSLTSIGSYLTITREDRKVFLQRVREEHEAYEAIRELHDKIIRLLDENNHAKAAATHYR